MRLGIDPGKNGAWALLDDEGRLVDADHFPLDEEGEIDAAELYHQLGEVGPIERATVEKVGSMGATKDGRRQGTQGIFNFGLRAGAVIAVLQVRGIPYDQVLPAVWKKASGVTADKKASLRAARDLWPSAATLLHRGLDEARAEAALIARYGHLVSFSYRRAP